MEVPLPPSLDIPLPLGDADERRGKGPMPPLLRALMATPLPGFLTSRQRHLQRALSAFGGPGAWASALTSAATPRPATSRRGSSKTPCRKRGPSRGSRGSRREPRREARRSRRQLTSASATNWQAWTPSGPFAHGCSERGCAWPQQQQLHALRPRPHLTSAPQPHPWPSAHPQPRPTPLGLAAGLPPAI